MGPNLSEDLFLIYLLVLHLILGARHRSSYSLEKFLSKALFAVTPFYDTSQTKKDSNMLNIIGNV